MGILHSVLGRLGYAKLDEFGLVRSADDRIVMLHRRVLDDGLGGRIVGWRAGDPAPTILEAMELVPRGAARQVEAARTALAQANQIVPQAMAPAPPPPRPQTMPPARPTARPSGAKPAPAAAAPARAPSQGDGGGDADADEWEWQMAMARARAAAEEAERAARTAPPAPARSISPQLPTLVAMSGSEPVVAVAKLTPARQPVVRAEGTSPVPRRRSPAETTPMPPRAAAATTPPAIAAAIAKPGPAPLAAAAPPARPAPVIARIEPARPAEPARPRYVAPKEPTTAPARAARGSQPPAAATRDSQPRVVVVPPKEPGRAPVAVADRPSARASAPVSIESARIARGTSAPANTAVAAPAPLPRITARGTSAPPVAAPAPVAIAAAPGRAGEARPLPLPPPEDTVRTLAAPPSADATADLDERAARPARSRPAPSRPVAALFDGEVTETDRAAAPLPRFSARFR